MLNRTLLRMRRGFTLVELLVVIGVIAVLISMLLPVLSKVRIAGNNVQCLSNLRQLAQWGTIYAGDWRGVLPHNGSPAPAYDSIGYKDLSKTWWYQKNPRYVGYSTSSVADGYYENTNGMNSKCIVRRPTVLHCPQLTDNVLPRHYTNAGYDYGINRYLGGQSAASDPNKPLKITRLTSAAFWFGDGRLPGSLDMSLYLTADPIAMYMVPWPWDPIWKGLTSHPNRAANFVFGDGHAESVTLKDAKARNQKEWLPK